MLTLVFGRFVSEAMVNKSLDLGLIAKKTTMFYGHKFVFTHFLYIKCFTSCIYKLNTLQVAMFLGCY